MQAAPALEFMLSLPYFIPMTPGRSCPLHYRYAPSSFERAADIRAETIYVIGGLYGNLPALNAIIELAIGTDQADADFQWRLQLVQRRCG